MRNYYLMNYIPKAINKINAYEKHDQPVLRSLLKNLLILKIRNFKKKDYKKKMLTYLELVWYK